MKTRRLSLGFEGKGLFKMAAKRKDNLEKEKLLAEIKRLRRAPMPRIFDNIEQSLLPALQETRQLSNCAVFCIGYFNLCGWKRPDKLVIQYA